MNDIEGFAYDHGFDIVDLPLRSTLGLLHGKLIALRKGMPYVQRRCVLAEEVGHGLLTVGDITNQDVVENRKQEQKARRWGYNKLISLSDLVEAAKHGCGNLWDTSIFLGVTEEFLEEALTDFRKQYGVMAVVDDYAIIFEPCLMVVDIESLNK